MDFFRKNREADCQSQGCCNCGCPGPTGPVGADGPVGATGPTGPAGTITPAAAVANATSAEDVVNQFNLLLANMRAAGLLAE